MNHFHSVGGSGHLGVVAGQLEHVGDAQPLPRLPREVVWLHTFGDALLPGRLGKGDECLLQVGGQVAADVFLQPAPFDRLNSLVKSLNT